MRSFILDMFAQLDDRSRARMHDALLRRAATAGTGWRPASPSKEIVDEVRSFVAAARRVGQADPVAVDKSLREGVRASLAGDHEAARAIFGMLLEPVADAEIDLGQHEMVDEVLSVDLHDCVVRFIAAVYLTSVIEQRADEVFDAIESIGELTHCSEPIAAMERVVVGPLPDLDPFLPLWISRLERDKPPQGRWESDRDRWLREAVARTEGTGGLERIARTTKQPEAVRAWCSAVVAEGDSAKSLQVYEDAAKLVCSATFRGDFLDGAALAARVLGRKDAAKKLNAAWLAAPSLLRLLRWLLADVPSAAAMKKRAAATLKACPTESPRLVGVLRVVIGDVAAAATLLENAPGLGWSDHDHPGHLLFPVFAWLLGGAPGGSVRGELAQHIHRPTSPELDVGYADTDEEANDIKAKAPRLATPSLVEALQRAGVVKGLSAKDRAAALAAMKAAATARVDGLLGEKRRRHYEHAARLVACCVELEDRSGRASVSSAWAEALRLRTSRFPAFQEALRRALSQARR